MSPRCPTCGRYLSSFIGSIIKRATGWAFSNIKGRCTLHGRVIVPDTPELAAQ